MIYNMEDDEFLEMVKKDPEKAKKIDEYTQLTVFAAMDSALNSYVDWESLDMLDEKIEVLKALRDMKPLPDGYENLMTLLPDGDNVEWD